MARFPFSPADRPIVIWHRGASDRALENSLSAFSLAAADRADMIEFDVRLTADGAPVVFHDVRTGRTARENVLLARCAASRLREVRLNNGEPIPRLAEVLELVGGSVPLDIDVKVRGGVEAAARVLDAASYRGPVLLSSSLREECLAARALRPDLPCALVTRRPSSSDLAFCLHRGMASIHPDHRTLSVLRLEALGACGVPFIPYTVDGPSVALALADAGAAGVFSNRPREIRDALEQRRRARG